MALGIGRMLGWGRPEVTGSNKPNQTLEKAMAQSQPSAAREQVRHIVPGLIDYSERVLFGEVWERPGLSKRDRSLIIVRP